MADCIVAWWLGEPGLLRLAELRGRAPERPRIALFPEGGHAALHAASGSDYVYVRCGPFGHGLPKPSVHSHADFMAPVVWLGGAPLLVDPGNYGYTTAGAERRAFRVEGAHSLFTIEGRPLGVPLDTFRWATIPPAGSLSVTEEKERLRIEGRWSPAGAAGKRVAAARTVVYNMGQRVIRFEDTWEAPESSSGVTVIWRWRFAAGTVVTPRDAAVSLDHAVSPDLAASLDQAAWQAQTPAGPLVTIHLAGEPGASLTGRIVSGFLSGAYAGRVAAPVLEITWPDAPRTNGRLFTQFVPVIS